MNKKSTNQVDSTNTSQCASLEDVNEAEGHDTENNDNDENNDTDESSEAEMGELNLIHKRIHTFADIN